jgi:outer membrane protein OmpA-like peptidoglycan-associated protein
MDGNIQPDPVTYLKARIVDATTKRPVQAQLELVNLTDKTKRKREETTDKNGEVLLVLPVGANYAFSVSKKGYLFFSELFVLSGANSFYEPYNLIIELQPVEVGAEMNLYNVYFETDSFTILPESEPELKKLVSFLKSNPGLIVEIQGHTDNTGTSAGNQRLSELRAKSVEEYLVQNGTQAQRLSSTGYGESRPVASNEKEEGRRLNRRTTIKILSQN